MGCRSKFRPGLGAVAALLAGGIFAVLQDLVGKDYESCLPSAISSGQNTARGSFSLYGQQMLEGPQALEELCVSL